MSERIEFSRSLYSPEAVRAAVDAYSQLASFEVQVLDDEIAVELENPVAKVADIIVDEFCNHVLFETINASRTVND